MNLTATDWQDYQIVKPAEEGFFEWRVPHRRLPLVVTFVCRNRMRGAGYENVVSPQFDHWDGYKVVVPKDVQWRSLDQSNYKSVELHGYHDFKIEGIEFNPCPFCKKMPVLQGIESSMHGGIFMGSKPHEYNQFYLRCCRWIATSWFMDPKELAKQWNRQ